MGSALYILLYENRIGSISSFIYHYKFTLTSLPVQITLSDLSYRNSHGQLDVERYTSNACRALNYQYMATSRWD